MTNAAARTVAVLPGLLLCSLLAAQSSERDAVSAFRRSFAVKTDALPRGATGTEVVKLLSGFDSENVATVLLRAHRAVDARIVEVETRKLEVNRGLHESLLGRAEDKVRGARQARTQRKELRAESWSLREELDGLRPVRVALEQRIAALRSERALKKLADQALSKERAAFGAQLAAARACGAAGAVGRKQLEASLRKAKSAGQLAAILDGVRMLGANGAAVLRGRGAELLAHESAAVREQAARALAAGRDPASVSPLIDLLRRSRGELRSRVAVLLEELTGQGHGENLGAWRAWYEDVCEDLLAGRLKLGGQRVASAKPKPRVGGTTYMGIPQNGQSLVYVLDASNSMKVAVDFEIPGHTVAGGGEATRLDACKAELNRALGTLPPTTRFNIVFLHETAGRFRDAPVLATPDNVAAARTWVRKREPVFATNVYDAMLEAYALMASDLFGRAVGDGIDTVFLLTDGRPVLFDPRKKGRAGVPDPFPNILAAIEDWDPLRRVTVHCIGIGKGLNKRMMRRLAEARGGEARFY